MTSRDRSIPTADQSSSTAYSSPRSNRDKYSFVKVSIRSYVRIMTLPVSNTDFQGSSKQSVDGRGSSIAGSVRDESSSLRGVPFGGLEGEHGDGIHCSI